MNKARYLRKIAKRAAALGLDTSTLMVTHTPEGSSYGLDNGAAVPPKIARELQGDLFVRPAEDGLFPGMSQTWKIEG